MWIQIVVSLFVLVVVWRLVINYHHRKISLRVFVAWIILWFGVALIFWSPEIASELAFFLGIGRGSDLIIYTAIIVIVYLIYRIFVRLEKVDKDITSLTRELALDHEREKKDSSRRLSD